MAKIPKQLFVTAKNDYKDELPLGFLHAHDDTKADAKRKATQLQWAYNEGWGCTLYGKDSLYYRKGCRWVWQDHGKTSIKEEFDEPVPFQPQIWENEPLEGFKILTSISRWSTSNKLWRVADPRGVQFEITTGCFEEIVLNSTIQNGLILDKCQWASNKNLVLVKN